MIQWQGTVGQRYQDLDTLESKRFTTFAFVNSSSTISIKIIGFFHLKFSVYMHPHIRGTIQFEEITYPVSDQQVLNGLEPKTITDESCIVFLTADESLRSFGTAVIVDDITELLSLADEVLRK